MKEPCYMCLNSHVDDDLTDENDLSFHSVGNAATNNRIMIAAGDGHPVRIIFEHWTGNHWETVGVYAPRFCPNCGRELTEYQNK